MCQRPWTNALVLAAAAIGLIAGCGKNETPLPAGAIPAPKAAALQINISGALPVVLGSDTIQAEIDKAGDGVKFVKLDLSSVGLPLTLDVPEGGKVKRGLSPRRDAEDIEISACDHFAIRIRPGKHAFEQKRQQLAGQKVLVNTNDLILSSAMLLLDERCEFARHVVVGLQDYTIENVAPLLGRQINHSQADCLLMLKCIGTLRTASTHSRSIDGRTASPQPARQETSTLYNYSGRELFFND